MKLRDSKTLGKYFDKKTCIYFDQYVVSNILDPQDSEWIRIRELINSGTESDKIITLYSFEHLLETSHRSIEIAKDHDRLLFKLSGGLKMRLEPIITSRMIRNRIRRKRDDSSTFVEEIKHGQITTSEEYKFYNDLRSSYKRKVEEATQTLNIIRGAASQGVKFDLDLQRGVIKFIVERDQNQITNRLETYSKFGTFKRKSINFSDITMPFWTDALMDILINNHKLTRKEAKRGKELINNYGLKIIPTVYIRSSIEGLMGVKQQKENINDHIDITRLSTAVPFADIVLTDKARHFDLTFLGLDKEFETEIYSGSKTEISKFKEKLEDLVC